MIGFLTHGHSKRTRASTRHLAGLSALSIVALLVLASPALSQTCRPADDNSASMLGYLKWLTTRTDVQSGYVRRDFKIPVVDTATIVLVTTSNVCNKVLQTFLAQLPAGFPTPLPTSIYVAKVGSVYVGMHHLSVAPPPAGTVRVDGSTDYHVVVDSKYKFLSKYAH
jgi:hypothetical protein